MNKFKKIEEYVDENGELKETLCGCNVVIHDKSLTYAVVLDEYTVIQFCRSEKPNLYFIKLKPVSGANLNGWQEIDLSDIKFVIDQEKPAVLKEQALIDMVNAFKNKPREPYTPLHPIAPLYPRYCPNTPKFDVDAPYCGMDAWWTPTFTKESDTEVK